MSENEWKWVKGTPKVIKVLAEIGNCKIVLVEISDYRTIWFGKMADGELEEDFYFVPLTLEAFEKEVIVFFGGQIQTQGDCYYCDHQNTCKETVLKLGRGLFSSEVIGK